MADNTEEAWVVPQRPIQIDAMEEALARLRGEIYKAAGVNAADLGE